MLLLKAGANSKASSNTGKRPIDYAEENKRLKGTPEYWALKDASY